MDADLLSKGEAVFAPLPQFATLSVRGADARGFLHAQLSNDVEHLQRGSARRAGYCSPKGRLLASFIVLAHADGFLLQVSRDIAATIAKRLSMYVLRSKVKLADESDAWAQFGVWGRDCGTALASSGIEVPGAPMQVAESVGRIVVCLEHDRYLVFAPAEFSASLSSRFAQVGSQRWTLADVRAGLPLISLPTQELFVPQMTNLELVGGIDFKKGCYPGQEIVARSQYLGKLKRRMYRAGTEACGPAAPVPGQDVYGADPQAAGTIVNAAPRPEGGWEFLAVMQASVAESGNPIRVGSPDGPPARILCLPYAL